MSPSRADTIVTDAVPGVGRRRFVVMWGAWVMLLMTASSGSAPHLEWSAPVGCPTRSQVLEDMSRLMGGDRASWPPQLRIRGRIDDTPWVSTLEIEIATPTRLTRKRLESDHCDVLARAAALMIVVTLDPLTIDERAMGSHAEDAPQVPPVERSARTMTRPSAERAPPPSASPESTSRAARWRALGFLSASGGLGTVPQFDARLAAGLGVLLPWLRIEAEGFHVLRRSSRYDDVPTVGADISAWGAAVRVGPTLTSNRVSYTLRVGGAAAAVVGHGRGVDDPRSRIAPWAAILIAPGLRWAVARRVALGVDLEASMALRRPSFALDVLPAVHRAESVGVRAGLTLELRLPDRSDDQNGPIR